jgi:hypothetical protein
MKWTRSRGSSPTEYSTGCVGLRCYISMSHADYSKHFWYTYSVNGEEILHGNFDANNWDEAEQIVVLRIRKELSSRAERWNQLLSDFDEEMSVNEEIS